MERLRPVDPNAVNIEWKLLQYSKQTNSKTYDSSRIQSDADKKFRNYIDNQVDKLILIGINK